VDTEQARSLFERYRGSVAYVEVETPTGDRHLGSAFHIGDGVFVTARHVVEGNEIRSVGTTEVVYIPLEGDEAATARTHLRVGDDDIPVHPIEPGTFTVVSGPHLALDARVDIAVFRVRDLDPRTPHFELGSHLDDWLGESDFVLSQVLILGYPPIPFARRPTLVASRADVVSQIDRYDIPHVQFIVSSIPRGGLSGGVVYSEWGFVLGVMTHSLLVGDRPEELGYSNVTSVEPIYACLTDHKLLPQCQAEMWDGLWNSRRLHFTRGDAVDMGAFRVVAGVELFDDGTVVRVDVHCLDLDRLEATISVVAEVLGETWRLELRHPGVARLQLATDYTDVAVAASQRACTEAVRHLLECGYAANGADAPLDFFMAGNSRG
jgi:hypothetical protein